MRLTEIRIFPVKALAGLTCDVAVVEPRGLAGDRRWMLIDDTGRFLSQREHPGMALIDAVPAQAGIVLHTHGQPPLFVAEPDRSTPPRPVHVWRDHFFAIPAAETAAAWLTRALGVPCALVFQADPTTRPVSPAFAAPGDVVSCADGFPLLLTTEASLAALNARLASPVPMLRFRPNLVVAGAPAWAEDSWRRLRIGTATFRVVKPCDRCVVTTIDPATATRPNPEEPLRTLKTFRRDATGRVYFGQNLIPDSGGEIRRGDAIDVLESGPPNVVVSDRAAATSPA
jgi:uncharacterized protein YcbX